MKEFFFSFIIWVLITLFFKFFESLTLFRTDRMVVGRYLWVHINTDMKLSVWLYIIVSSTPLFSCRLQGPRDEHAGALAYAAVGSGHHGGGMFMRSQWPCGVVHSMRQSLKRNMWMRERVFVVIHEKKRKLSAQISKEQIIFKFQSNFHVCLNSELQEERVSLLGGCLWQKN